MIAFHMHVHISYVYFSKICNSQMIAMQYIHKGKFYIDCILMDFACIDICQIDILRARVYFISH